MCKRLSHDDIAFLLAVGYKDANNEYGYTVDCKIIEDLKNKGVVVELTKEGVEYKYV